MLKALYRSTPFRLMALLSMAFLAFLGLAGFIAFGLIRAELDARLTQQLEQTFSIIAQSYGENDLTDLVDLVRSNAAANPALERVFLLRGPASEVLGGNITTAPTATGWSVTTAAQLGLTADDEMYRIYSGAVGGNTLVVGASFDETEAVGSIVLNSLGMAGVLFVILVVIAGILIATRGQRRMDRIANTMALVGRGELAARIPVQRNRDDLDDLSTQINHALERLAGLVEGMRQVSVDIAHDLKTPLNRLSFTVQNAIESEEAGQSVATLLQQAQEETRQINMTFEALLRIAQIESGARRARFKDLAVAPILQTLFEAYADVAEENGQTLTIAVEPLPDIHGDKDLLTQLFANLIENAIRHCPPGTTIAMSADATNGQVFEVSVRDNGSGIPDAERDKVFQRLYRLDKSRSTPGHGLGLSLVKAIAELHGATIMLADNRPGLCVRVKFPQTNAATTQSNQFTDRNPA
ncbi:MAG: integral rane sensor signal transduction histidine kinase [Devosia sp.]|uniref:HAMP domain-containing sensor histidine kinase n=1 Tax=Devosia sp. TaxID=1871048 RepID=UPI00260C3073|nr:ATP-binding protein [Devosia sp.]MDB5587139.1 integral rane sensor signal transduction histidine kinase [Devosia sp.]